jgi:hypothetical protein
VSAKKPQPNGISPSSVNQKYNKTSDLSAHRKVTVLTVLFRSPSLSGRAFRTLLYYARKTQAPLRDEDLYVLMAISAAEQAAKREAEREA